MAEVILDIETIGDIKNFSELEVTVVSVYSFETGSYASFEEQELSELWPIFERASRLIGYNSEHFDLPILNKYYAGNLLQFPHLDMLKVIKESVGRRIKLDDVAQATLQSGKSGDGLQAMKWWQNGEKQKVKDYCEQDVRVTRELYEYGRKNKMLYYKKLTGELQPFPVNFDAPSAAVQNGANAPRTVNLTLPL